MSNNDNPQLVIVRHDLHVHEVPPTRKQITEKVEEPPKKWFWVRMQETCQKNSDKKCSYKCWSEIIQILCDTLGVCLLFVFENLLGIVFLILGIVFINDCPIDPSIPISLLVFGVVSMIHAIVVQFIRWKWIDIKAKNDGFATCAQVVLVITSLIYLVALFWAAFAVFHWSGKVKTNSDDKGSENYCNAFLFWFAFWFFIFLFILMTIILVLICFLFCIVISAAGVESPPPQVIVVHRHQESSPLTNQSMSGQQSQQTAPQSSQSSAPPQPIAQTSDPKQSV